ncbi:MAG TPA: hypothetical protein VEG08_14365 [Terriglobales bacterium]|nr:hypothetical protein [Terriglobales bacterium]
MRLKSALALASLGLLLALGGCRFFQSQQELPSELYGVWRTSAPGYEGRFLQLQKGFVIFGVDENTAMAQHIRKVKAVKEGEETLYTVSSEEVGGEASELKFYYSPANRTIRFANQDLVWTKEEPPRD